MKSNEFLEQQGSKLAQTEDDNLRANLALAISSCRNNHFPSLALSLSNFKKLHLNFSQQSSLWKDKVITCIESGNYSFSWKTRHLAGKCLYMLLVIGLLTVEHLENVERWPPWSLTSSPQLNWRSGKTQHWLCIRYSLVGLSKKSSACSISQKLSYSNK